MQCCSLVPPIIACNRGRGSRGSRVATEHASQPLFRVCILTTGIMLQVASICNADDSVAVFFHPFATLVLEALRLLLSR